MVLHKSYKPFPTSYLNFIMKTFSLIPIGSTPWAILYCKDLSNDILPYISEMNILLIGQICEIRVSMDSLMRRQIKTITSFIFIEAISPVKNCGEDRKNIGA